VRNQDSPAVASGSSSAPATIFAAAFLLTAAASSHTQQSAISRPLLDPPPYWAYAVNPPASPSDASAQPDESAQLHVPGSKISFTNSQIHDFFNVPDWHPSSHPQMPVIAATAANPVSTPAPTAISPTARVARRIPASRDFPPTISSSNSPTSKAAPAKLRSRPEDRQQHDRRRGQRQRRRNPESPPTISPP